MECTKTNEHLKKTTVEHFVLAKVNNDGAVTASTSRLYNHIKLEDNSE